MLSYWHCVIAAPILVRVAMNLGIVCSSFGSSLFMVCSFSTFLVMFCSFCSSRHALHFLLISLHVLLFLLISHHVMLFLLISVPDLLLLLISHHGLLFLLPSLFLLMSHHGLLVFAHLLPQFTHFAHLFSCLLLTLSLLQPCVIRTSWIRWIAMPVSALGNLSACVLALMCGWVYMCVTSTWPKKIHVYTLAPSFFLLLIITISLLQPCIIWICSFKLSARGKLSACVLGQCVHY